MVEYTRVDGYAIVIPQDWNLSLKVAGHEELSVVGKSNVSADGLTLAPRSDGDAQRRLVWLRPR